MKKAAKVLQLILLIFIFISIWMHDHNSEVRHQEQMNVQDSINARYQYVIDYHFGDCDFTPNEKHKPFR